VALESRAELAVKPKLIVGKTEFIQTTAWSLKVAWVEKKLHLILIKLKIDG
jgi:hypothetical protein